MAAVPVKQHPWRERRLLRFGRDLLFRSVWGLGAGRGVSAGFVIGLPQ